MKEYKTTKEYSLKKFL